MIKRLLFLGFCFWNQWLFADTFFMTEPVFQGTLYMHTEGDATRPAVVLVHGLGNEASSIWETTIEHLKEHYFVVTFDLPGFGKSSQSNELYSPLNYAKVIRYVTQTYVKKPFHLLGHSMGGAIALKYASMYPSDVESLILVDVAGILHRSEYNTFLMQSGVHSFFDEQNELTQSSRLGRFVDKMSEKIDRKMSIDMSKVLPSEALRSSVLGGNPMRIAAVALVEENFSGIPQKIKARTTIVWGELDDVAPIETGYVLHKLMENATFKIVSGAKHVPMLTHEEAFWAILKEHLMYPKAPLRPVPPPQGPCYTLELRDVSDKTYSGVIESIRIQDSQRIVIKDALVGELVVVGSDVEIINSTLKGSKEVVVSAQNAKVSIVASNVFGKIRLYNVKLHLLGTHIETLGKPIETLLTSFVFYSLCQINDKRIHGKEILNGK
jgi:pimeloyl-ACP methyl ester carboxylesterase